MGNIACGQKWFEKRSARDDFRFCMIHFVSQLLLYTRYGAVINIFAVQMRASIAYLQVTRFFELNYEHR